MPSLFSRARTNSKAQSLLSSHNASDEFGRTAPSPVPTIPDGAFLPLSLELRQKEQTSHYGFLSYERHVILAPEQLARLVHVVVDELSSRGGITTPFIFSTTALDVSYSSIKRLVRAFLDTCDMRSSPSVEKAEAKWKDEARFAGLHELGMCLRWGLARVSRINRGQEIRGLIPWDHYVRFRDSEAANRYPPGHFQTFLQDLAPTIQFIVTTVLTFLIRLTANSTCSGHTPPTLSPLFGPLFFGLGPASLSFHHTYLHYLRATNAMEHIILAFIRWQDTPRTGASAALGVPARLKDWIKGYPSMLPFLNESKKDKDNLPQSRKGARTIRLLNVRRNVRMYSPDLVKTAASWGSRTVPRSSPGPSNALYASKEWERVAPLNLKLAPKYSEQFKKRMNIPPNFIPDSGPGYDSGAISQVSSTSSYKSTVSSTNNIVSSEFGHSLSPHEGEDRFRSLTDLKWGEFESMGFGGIGDEKKLEFDLTESARQERSRKRQTLSWNDFSAAGFSRSDGPLSATLQFSSPIANTITSWPSHKAEISKKLKKAEKSLPHFGWDTEPVMFNEEVIEEAFMDVFCDLIYGGGWMDNERCEEVERDSNWAMVEFKATPANASTTSGGADPRTMTSLLLFEEFVPLEYRQKLAQSSSTRRRLPSLFTPKSKQWKPAATLNGKPYEVGHVPRSPTYREVEFEGLLHADNATKVISLATTPAPRISSFSTTGIDIPPTPKSERGQPFPPLLPPKNETLHLPPLPPKSDSQHSVESTPSSKRASRFRLPVTPVLSVPNHSVRRKSGVPPAQYSIVEFETRLASYSDDEYNNANETESAKQRRRLSKDDAWVDILVGNQQRLLVSEPDSAKGMSLRGAHSDPDLASMEVAQVLAAAVKNRPPSPPSVVGPVDRVDRDYGIDQHVLDLDVEEIETVPRTSDATTRSSEYSGKGEHGDAEDNDEHEHEPEQDDDDAEEEGGEELKEVVVQARLRARRGRPGYFDLHPERLHQVHSMDVEEELKAKLAQDTTDEEPEYGEATPPPSPPLAVAAPEVAFLDKTPVQETHLDLPQEAEVQRQPAQPPHQQKRTDGPATTATTPTTATEAIKTPGATGMTNGDHAIESPKPTIPQSRTAALIEMYRERERSAIPKPTSPIPTIPQVVSIPPAPVITLPAEPAPVPLPAIPVLASRIPVKQQKEQISVTVPVPTPAGEQEDYSPPRAGYEEPKQIALEEFERASPGRYIHGAPLHNVLEEEEEED